MQLPRSAQIGPERGGVGWRYPFARSNTFELDYTVAFSPGFDWVKGGELPGLLGGPKSVTGGTPANGMHGFSVTLMCGRMAAAKHMFTK